MCRKGTFHPWMVLLNEQRRMDPAISGFINANIYKSLLSDHPCVISNKPFDEILTLHNLRFYHQYVLEMPAHDIISISALSLSNWHLIFLKKSLNQSE